MMGLILALLAKIQQVLGKIGNGGDAAAMDGTLFAGQQAIFDAVGGISGSPVVIAGACDAGMSGSTTTVVSADLAGYGDDYFNNNWFMQVVKNDNSVGGAPSGETQRITDYDSATGTFTCDAFAANVEAGDEVLVLHSSLVNKDYQEFTSPGSGDWTVPQNVYEVDVIIVGGGGSGRAENDGGIHKGGGGGAEVVTLNRYSVTPGNSIAYVVGAGGAGASEPSDGNNGGNSSFDGITAQGGGKGTSSSGGKGGGFPTYTSVNMRMSPFTGTGGFGGQEWRIGGATSNTESGQNGHAQHSNFMSRIGGGGGGRGEFGNGGACLSPGGSPYNAYKCGAGGGSWGDGTDGKNTSDSATKGGGSGGALFASGDGGDGYIKIMWKG